MKTMMSLVSIILVVCLVFSLGATAYAAEESKEETGKTVVSSNYDGLKKIEDHLYEIGFDSIDYSLADKVFASDEVQINAAGCSSVRCHNYYGRNLDWFFDDCVEVVVHTKAHNGRFATLGVVGAVSSVNQTSIDDGSINKKLGIIPFAVVDGINEKGVFMNVNVVPGSDLETPNTVIMPTGDVEATVNSGMIVRFVLDNFGSAEEAVKYLQEHVSIEINENVKKLGFETHWMLGDERHTYILEMVDNKLNAVCTDIGSGTNLEGKPIMTNFYLTLPEVNFDKDGKVKTNHDGKPNASGITPHAVGLERYNVAVDEYENADSFLGMHKLMSDLYYSRTYNSHLKEPWYSELAGGDVTNSSPIEDYASAETVLNNYLTRDREKGNDSIWITTHSSIYDIASRELYITAGERMTGYRITFEG